MAVPTGAGTETLHSHCFADVDATQTLIFGVQHHVYTVLSFICHCIAVNAASDVGQLRLKHYDNHGGASGATIAIAQFNLAAGETYVWNDKFSFNGYEPTGTATMSAAQQIANAAQAGSADAELYFDMSHADDDFDIIISYLDQDWS